MYVLSRLWSWVPFNRFHWSVIGEWRNKRNKTQPLIREMWTSVFWCSDGFVWFVPHCCSVSMAIEWGLNSVFCLAFIVLGTGDQGLLLWPWPTHKKEAKNKQATRFKNVFLLIYMQKSTRPNAQGAKRPFGTLKIFFMWYHIILARLCFWCFPSWCPSFQNTWWCLTGMWGVPS